MGTQCFHSPKLRDGRMRGERSTPQYGSLEGLHIPAVSLLFLDQPLQLQPAKDLCLCCHHDLWGCVPSWGLVFWHDQRGASERCFHLVSRTRPARTFGQCLRSSTGRDHLCDHWWRKTPLVSEQVRHCDRDLGPHVATTARGTKGSQLR